MVGNHCLNVRFCALRRPTSSPTDVGGGHSQCDRSDSHVHRPTCGSIEPRPEKFAGRDQEACADGQMREWTRDGGNQPRRAERARWLCHRSPGRNVSLTRIDRSPFHYCHHDRPMDCGGVHSLSLQITKCMGDCSAFLALPIQWRMCLDRAPSRCRTRAWKRACHFASEMKATFPSSD